MQAALKAAETAGEDDVIVFSPTTSSPLMRVPASGGTPEPLTRLDTGSGEVSHRYPQVLSGGHGVIYAVTTGRNDQRIAAQRLAAADHITLVSDGVNPYFMPGSGQLVYADSSGELFAAPFDASRLSFSGPAVARHERPAWFGIFGTMGFSASELEPSAALQKCISPMRNKTLSSASGSWIANSQCGTTKGKRAGREVLSGEDFGLLELADLVAGCRRQCSSEAASLRPEPRSALGT